MLLSVGYSACHWCHVMAHESFEDPETAALMNELFVNVKVDREERPDVDSVYMDAVQALTGRGGWPMTVFLTPDGEPFYGGTYWPREPFQRLLRAVDDAWRNRRDELRQNVDALVEVVSRTARVAPARSYDAVELLRTTLSSLASSFDGTWGGFGAAPKFPSTFALDLVLRAHLERRDPETERIVLTSLDAMASGGMWDHIGGGFARYSVDDRWLVPHFEKMLYDQSLLLRIYVRAWQVFGHDRHLRVATEIVDYVLECLALPAGGLCSAEDADSLDEHGHSEEGAFYTWTPAEVRNVLGEGADDAMEWWDISGAGHFEGRSIPNRLDARDGVVRPAHIEGARAALKSARAQRPRPGLDDKVLTEWNAMFLASLCEAAAAAGRRDWRDTAERIGQFLLDHLRAPNGRWHRSWTALPAPAASHTAVAHDLAQVVDAMTRLYELTGGHHWITAALSAADQLVEHHADDEHGGFFTVATDAEQLVARQKDLMDNATPSANSAAAAALLRLAALSGRDDLRERAHDTLRLLATVAPAAPSAFCNAMGAVHMATEGITEIVIPGDRPDLVAVCREKWRPNTVIAHGDPLIGPLWQERTEGNAYVCRDGACRLPVSQVADLRDELARSCFGG
ncbi:MAG: hypothetical protein RLY50_599 [Actinomycetota bacterium]